jgi:hypothetical protein
MNKHMKYVYGIIALAVIIGGGYFLVASLTEKSAQQAQEIPEGYHLMPDGTLMRNDAGTEGMGSLSELQNQIEREEPQGEEASLSTDQDAKVFEVRGSN